MQEFDITLAGEANVDLLLYGLPEELTVEREWIADRMAMTLGGSPAITAHNLAVMGSRVGYVTPVTRDAFANLGLQALREAGVDLSRIVSAPTDIHTGISILLQHEHSRRTLTYSGATATLTLANINLEYLCSSRHFHLSSYFLQQALRPDAARLLQYCHDAGLTTSLDTNDDPSGTWSPDVLELLPYVDVFMPNEREACALMREPDPETAIRQLAAHTSLLVVKRGHRGAVALRGAERWQVKGIALDTVDAVGAGDSFNAGFLHGYVRGWQMESCLELGNLSGAYSTTGLGGTEAFRDRQRWQAFAAAHASGREELVELVTSNSI